MSDTVYTDAVRLSEPGHRCGLSPCGRPAIVEYDVRLNGGAWGRSTACTVHTSRVVRNAAAWYAFCWPLLRGDNTIRVDKTGKVIP